MKIAIIGGGAAGMAAVWYLGEHHQITMFERQATLGGNIRSLGRNVPRAGLPADLTLDAGVVEFSLENFPRFHALMDELDVELHDVPGTTALFVDGCPPLASPGNTLAAGRTWVARLAAWWRLLPVARAHRQFFACTRDVSLAELYGRTLDAYLDEGPFAEWARLLMLYAYSIPQEHLGRLSAALAVPALRTFLEPHQWTAIRGGVYTWIERVLERRSPEIHTSARIRAVRRSSSGVGIDLETGERLRFDKVVIATTPEQVLHLLTDATDDERRRFGAWESSEVCTLVHSDTGLYQRRGIRYFSEFDLFHTAAGLRGYNAYLNRLCAVPESADTHYSLSYGIDEEIDPASVVHRQPHRTPLYTVEAMRTREEIKATNGQRHTVFAGAWLDDGLHEGAIRSGREAASLTG
ncbi:MAG: FAD-dependent oxidoreductase [bacterium]|nr:FAD-dependent oxidoreductase [bacterium]